MAASSKMDRLMEEVRELVEQPFVLDFEGRIHLEETDDGLVIRLLKKEVAAPITVPQATAPQEAEEKPIIRRPRATNGATPANSGITTLKIRMASRRKILNANNIPGFEGFILQDGTVTKRASKVLESFGIDPDTVAVPGREIIEWAKNHPDVARGVFVQYDGNGYPLPEFVEYMN